MQYESDQLHVMTVLYRRGPKVRRRHLIALLRHNFSWATLKPVLDALAHKGLVYEYRERYQNARRMRERQMVALTERGVTEMMLQ